MNMKIMKNSKKIAVVTGGSEGIGAALVEELLILNFNVYAISRSKNKLKKLKTKLSNYANRLSTFSADVTSSRKLKKIAEQIETPDLLILNAGIYKPVTIENFDINIFKIHNDVNYMGIINSFDAFIKKMLDRKGRSILIMSSVAGWIGLPKASAYSPTKASLRSFAQSIRYDLLKYNVDIKICSPGFVNTNAIKYNDFYMPGLIEPKKAAKLILKGLSSKRFEISFPFAFSLTMKILYLIPDKLSFLIIKYITVKNDQ